MKSSKLAELYPLDSTLKIIILFSSCYYYLWWEASQQFYCFFGGNVLFSFCVPLISSLCLWFSTTSVNYFRCTLICIYSNLDSWYFLNLWLKNLQPVGENSQPITSFQYCFSCSSLSLLRLHYMSDIFIMLHMSQIIFYAVLAIKVIINFIIAVFNSIFLFSS